MTTDKPDCDICGQPYRQHNIITGVAFCPIFATYRPKSSTLSQQADLIEKLREGLEGIRDLCDEEIRVRFGGHPHMSIEQCGRKSKIYALLVLPRNLAREALTTIPDTMRDERAMIVAWLKAKNNPASDYTALCIERGDHLSGEHLKDRGEAG